MSLAVVDCDWQLSCGRCSLSLTLLPDTRWQTVVTNHLLPLSALSTPARAGGVLLLIGFGSFIWYRLLRRRCVALSDPASPATNPAAPATDSTAASSPPDARSAGSVWQHLHRYCSRVWRAGDRLASLGGDTADLTGNTHHQFEVQYFGPVEGRLSPTFSVLPSRGRCRKRHATSCDAWSVPATAAAAAAAETSSWPVGRGVSLSSRSQSTNSQHSRDSTPYQADCSGSLSTDEQSVCQSVAECELCHSLSSCSCVVITPTHTIAPTPTTSTSDCVPAPMGNKCDRADYGSSVHYSVDSDQVLFTQLSARCRQGATLSPAPRADRTRSCSVTAPASSLPPRAPARPPAATAPQGVVVTTTTTAAAAAAAAADGAAAAVADGAAVSVVDTSADDTSCSQSVVSVCQSHVPQTAVGSLHTSNGESPQRQSSSTGHSSGCTPVNSAISRRRSHHHHHHHHQRQQQQQQRLQRRLSDAARSGGPLCVSVGELSRLCNTSFTTLASPPPLPPPLSSRSVRDTESSADSSGSYGADEAVVELEHEMAGDEEAEREEEDGTQEAVEEEEDGVWPEEVLWPDSLGVSTVQLMEQLQQQLDLIKSDVNCLDSELVTLHFPHCSPDGATTATAAAGGAGGKWKVSMLGRSLSEYHVHGTAASTPLDSPRDSDDHHHHHLGRRRGTVQTETDADAAAADAGISDCTVTDASLEWDSPSHGWTPLSRRPPPPLPLLPPSPLLMPPLSPRNALRTPRRTALARSVSLQNSSCASVPPGGALAMADTDLPSLEWDHSGIAQYDDVAGEDQQQSGPTLDNCTAQRQCQQQGQQQQQQQQEEEELLMMSVELDMERELLDADLMGTTDTVADTSALPCQRSTSGHVTSTPCRPASLVFTDIGCVSGPDTSGYEGTDGDGCHGSCRHSAVASCSQTTSLSHADSGAVSSCDSGHTPPTRELSGQPCLRRHASHSSLSSSATASAAAATAEILVSAGGQRRPPAAAAAAQRDSAYCDDGLDTEAARAMSRAPAVGEPLDLVEYGCQEWAGATERAATIRAGYCAAAAQLRLGRLQVVRGDHYCAIRAALYQLVATAGAGEGAAGGGGDGSSDDVGGGGQPQLLRVLFRDGVEAELASLPWLERWTFGSRLSFCSVSAGVRQCLHSFTELLCRLNNTTGTDDGVGELERDSGGCGGGGGGWRRRLCTVWNSDPACDLRLMEAVKLLMLARAVALHRQMQQHTQSVPEFVSLLFARDSSRDPLSLMLNHLNLVGDSAGLEQVDMCLLADTLGATLRVVRPSAYGQADFVSHYPPSPPSHQQQQQQCLEVEGREWQRERRPPPPPPSLPLLTLIAEDDRHYNIASHD